MIRRAQSLTLLICGARPCRTITHVVSTWLRADGAAPPGRGQGEVAVRCGTDDRVTDNTALCTQTSHTGLRGPDGLVEHGQALVLALAPLTWKHTALLVSPAALIVVSGQS